MDASHRLARPVAGPLLAALVLFACAPAPTAQPWQATAGGEAAAPQAGRSPAGTLSVPGASAALPSDSLIKVRMGVMGIAPEAGLYIAIERGYFRDEGLELELVPFRSGADQMAPLATGELQMGDGGLDPSLFNAVQRDIGVKIVGHNAMATPGDASAALVVRQDLVDSGQVREIKDLQGLTIAVHIEGTTAQLYVERSLARAGLTRDDVRFTIVQLPEMIAALTNKAVDAAWEIEPFVSVSEARGVARALVPMAEAYPRAPTMIVMMSPQFAAQQPEAARRFVTAHLQGQRDYWRAFVKNEGGRDEIIEVLTRYTQLKDPAQYARLGWHGVDPNGELDLAVMDDLQQYFLEIGSQQQKLDLARVIDRSYLESALGRLGRVAP
jgi:NitT/TauT family transport system substrate-binding protein